MINFSSDYLQGCHPEILKKLIETNLEKTGGYGTDDYCKSAKQKILAECGLDEADVYFVVGGTECNALVCKSFLQPYEGVIACDTSHINIHEAGAIETGGHKVITYPNINGKLKANDVKECLEKYYNDDNCDHMVMPGMVYISQPTEIGTLYSYKELKDLSDVCTKYHIPLYCDGARLGYGLVTLSNDVSLKDLSKLCDIFYIGGTKVGAMFGEALVITKKYCNKHFISILKQNGALLAKGRLLGIQFDVLFTNGLYYEISKQAIKTSTMIREKLVEKGYNLCFDSPTNQIFLLLDDDKYQEIKKKMICSFWDKPNEKQTIIRLATSWATTINDVWELLKVL